MIKRLWYASGAAWGTVLVLTGLGIGGIDLPYVHRVMLTVAGVLSACALMGHIVRRLVVPRTIAAARIWELGYEAGQRDERERLRGMPVVVPMQRHCGPGCAECRPHKDAPTSLPDVALTGR